MFIPLCIQAVVRHFVPQNEEDDFWQVPPKCRICSVSLFVINKYPNESTMSMLASGHEPICELGLTEVGLREDMRLRTTSAAGSAATDRGYGPFHKVGVSVRCSVHALPMESYDPVQRS